MDSCSRFGESLGLCMLIFYLLPTDCFLFFFGGCVFLFGLFITETVFVLCVIGQNNVNCYQWICVYLCIYIFRFYFQFSLLVVLFLFFFLLVRNERKYVMCSFP